MSKTKLPTVDADELPRPDRCGTCRFWDVQYSDGEPIDAAPDLPRFCHRYPPVSDQESFPEMDETEWCGEWQAKDGSRKPIDASALLDQLDSDAIRARLKEIERGRLALIVLLRAAGRKKEKG